MSVHSAHAASTLVVTTTADTGPSCQPSTYSLGCAITQANKDGSGDTISFHISSGCSLGVCIIRPQSALPPLTANATTINGYTQTGAHPNSNPLSAGDNAKIAIRLDGARVGTGHAGITLAGSHDMVEGLSITGFACTTYAGYCLSNGTNGSNGDGIYIKAGASHDMVSGNFIGVAPDGRTIASNSYGLIADALGSVLARPEVRSRPRPIW